MALISRTFVSGVRCDRSGCEATVTGQEIPDWEAGMGGNARHYFEALAESRGWTIWVVRGRTLRCPNHPVTPGKSTSAYSRARRTTEAQYPYCRRDECPCKSLPLLED